MLLTVLIVVAVVLIAVLAFAANKPDTFRIERAIAIHAAPEKIMALLDDFHNWASWSPWERLDPAMQRKFSGTPRGTGAVYEWAGNKKVGTGRMEILDIAPGRQLRIKLDFFIPFEAHNTAEFTLQPHDQSVLVNWAMFGPANFGMKLMHVFMNMDSMIGKDFETGLANLKSLAER